MPDPVLVDPLVSRRKYEREVTDLLSPVLDVRKQGWIVEPVGFPIVRVTFLTAHLPFPVAEFTVEMDFTNYDFLPLSVKFLHPTTLRPLKTIAGFQMTEQGPRHLIIAAHPDTRLPFLCLPGVREYHTHPEHNGDAWDLHRYSKNGRLYVILERLWRFCVRPVSYIVVPEFPKKEKIPFVKAKP